jgi:Ion channel
LNVVVFHAQVAAGAVAAGILLVLGVLWDAFETVVLSRRVSRRFRLTTIFYRITWPTWRRLARHYSPGNRRENFLTIYGPMSLLVLIGLWAATLVFGFALVDWGAGARVARGEGLATFLYMSGETLFTLGMGDVAPQTGAGRAVTVLESGIGLGFLALMIAYLPVLSSAFSSRERNIALLDARAGSPPTAAELIRRHGLQSNDGALVDLLREWERWSAELLESHVSFPVLAFYRSQHDNQSWVAGLTAMLDACSLLVAYEDRLDPGLTRQARLTFAMARHAVADMCRVLGRAALPIERDRLPAAVVARTARQAGIPGEADVPPLLAQMRRMYEPLVNALSEYLDMPLPPWCPKEPPRENWMTNL